MNARIPSNFRQLAFAAAAGALVFSAEAANTKEKAPKNPVYAPQAKVSDARFQEALEFIVQKMKPDEKFIEGRMAQLDTKSGSGQKLGVERFRARYDKSPQYAMACLALGQNLEEANALLLRWAKSYASYEPEKDLPVGGAGETDPSKIFRIMLLPSCAQNLSDEAKALIADAAFNWCNKMSHIDPKEPAMHNAAMGPWYMSGSENHDATDKRATLLGLQILNFASKKYHGGTELADGRTVKEHYDAWVAYWKENIRQRAREGLFCEVAQPGSYGRATNGTYLDFYDVTPDPVLKRLSGDMLSLHFAQLAGEYEPRTGTRGALAITRAKDGVDQQFGSHWTKNLTFAFGWSDAHADQLLQGESQILTTTWRPPAVVTAIARGPRLPPYFSVMRNFGLGPPKNADNVNTILFADGDLRNSYIRRTSWIAPEYMVSGMTIDPNREYLRVNQQSRLAGVSFSSGVNDRIIVVGNGEKKKATDSDTNTIVSKDCLIVGRLPQAGSVETRAYVSGGNVWNSRTEDPSGWQFFQAGDAFCALRIASGYSVREGAHAMGYDLVFEDIDAPAVLQTGRVADYPGGLEEFKKAVLARTEWEWKDYGLRYKSLAGDTLKFWTKEKKVPELNGKPFDLNPKYTYESPYLTMIHGEDTATIKYPGYEDVVLNFSYKQ